MIVYDSNCAACCAWARRWGSVIRCIPNTEWSGLPVDKVYYIMPDGSVLAGAAAVLEVESCLGWAGVLLRFFYRRFAFVRLNMEAMYAFVARHRRCGRDGCRVS